MQTRLIRYSTALFTILLSALLCPSLFLAQTNTTALSGTVTDVTGAVISAAEISISNAASGSRMNTQTTSKGEFSFEQVQPGTYEVKVVAPGFAEQNEKVELLVSTPVKLAFKLAIGTSEQTVTVETNLAEVNTTDATLGKAF